MPILRNVMSAGHQDKVTAFIMEDFQLDRKTAEASLREIVKNYSKDGTTADKPCAATSISFANRIKSRLRFRSARCWTTGY